MATQEEREAWWRSMGTADRLDVMVAENERLWAENERLRRLLDEAQLRSIEARNPGIDMEQVKRARAR